MPIEAETNLFTQAFETTRMDDRSARFGFIYEGRKQVHKLHLGDGLQAVSLLVPDQKYAPLFEKNLQGYLDLNKHGFPPNLIVYDQEQQFLVVSWAGKNAQEAVQSSPEKAQNIILKATNYLEEINTLHKQVKSMNLPKYLSECIKFKNQISQSSIGHRLVTFIKDLPLESHESEFGSGITDPALSNFALDKDRSISLIDLDNYRRSINLQHEIAFLLADFMNTDYHQGKKLITTHIQGLTQTQRLDFLLGLTAKHCIPLLDKAQGRKSHIRPFDIKIELNECLDQLQQLLT